MTRNAHRPLLTLTTDFGTADGYVGAIKGRVLSMVPDATICDISHEIAPQAVLQGAWCLKRAASEFPSGTVHFAVVDPGVGSTREALIVETERFLLVGPDNGLLSLVAGEAEVRRIVAIAEAPPERVRSRSFDGLTLFAPAAARLLLGSDPEELGSRRESLVELVQREPELRGAELVGEILFFDRFGNGITNFKRSHLPEAEGAGVLLPDGVEAEFCGHYSALAAKPGRPGALWNSDGHLELALFADSLQARFGLSPGAEVRLLSGETRWPKTGRR